jgi:hypothetical protein
MAETVELAGTRLLGPAHVCAFFSSQEAEEAVYLPFIQAGIAAGEKCVHILEAERRDEKRAKLGALGIDIAAAEDTGQLELRPWEHAHVVGGHFDQARMLDGLARAAASGGNAFGCTRLWSNQEWSLKDIPGVEDILEYEARFNYIWPKYNDVFVCVYDITKYRPNFLMQVLRTHPFSIVDNVLKENPFYVPPDVFLRELHSRKGSVGLH